MRGEMLSKISHFVVHNYMKCDRKQMVTIPLRKLERGFEIWVIFNGWQRQSEWEVYADHSRPHWNIKSFLICSHCEQVALAAWQGDAGKSLFRKYGKMLSWKNSVQMISIQGNSMMYLGRLVVKLVTCDSKVLAKTNNNKDWHWSS